MNHDSLGPKGGGQFVGVKSHPPKNGIPIYILSRARVVGFVGKKTGFYPFLDPSWTQCGSLLGPLLWTIGVRRGEKRYFT